MKSFTRIGDVIYFMLFSFAMFMYSKLSFSMMQIKVVEGNFDAERASEMKSKTLSHSMDESIRRIFGLSTYKATVRAKPDSTILVWIFSLCSVPLTKESLVLSSSAISIIMIKPYNKCRRRESNPH